MSKEREKEIEERLIANKHQEVSVLFIELFTLRRERHRDKLEGAEDVNVRGRAKECKDLLYIFS